MSQYLAVLALIDPGHADDLMLPEGSWHLAQMTDAESIENGDIGRQFADVLPGVCSMRSTKTDV